MTLLFAREILFPGFPAQQTTASGLRRATGEQDGGGCRGCGLDCFRLVTELEGLLSLSQVGMGGWEQRGPNRCDGK